MAEVANFEILLHMQQLWGTETLPLVSETSSHAAPHTDSTSEKPNAPSLTLDLLGLGNSSRVTLSFLSHWAPSNSGQVIRRKGTRISCFRCFFSLCKSCFGHLHELHYINTASLPTVVNQATGRSLAKQEVLLISFTELELYGNGDECLHNAFTEVFSNLSQGSYPLLPLGI